MNKFIEYLERYIEEEKIKNNGEIEDEEDLNKISYECECGKTIKMKNKEKHENTKTHITGVERKYKKKEKKEKKPKKQKEIKENNEEQEDEQYLDTDELREALIKEFGYNPFEGKPKPEPILKKEVKRGGFKNTVTNISPKETNEEVKEKPKKEKKKQLRHSNFFMTLNTNQRYDEMNEEFAPFVAKFKASLQDLFNNHMKDIVKIKEGDSEDDIRDVKTEFCVEKAPTTNTIHSHAIISISHYTNVQLDYKFITEYIKQQMGLDNLYLKNKVFYGANNSQTLKDYIEKSAK
jgi:hypothetical protein